jgi:hypothetical protein
MRHVFLCDHPLVETLMTEWVKVQELGETAL